MRDADPNDDRDRDDDRERPDEGRTDRGSVVHLGVNLGIGSIADLLGGVLDRGNSTRPRKGRWQRVDDAAGSGREDSSREGSADSTIPEPDGPVDVADEHLVDAHRDGDEFVVRAELPGVDEDDLSVGIDVSSDDLVIAADGQTIDRVGLPWSSTEAARVWYNNGILEVRLRPDEDGEGDGS